MSFLNNLNPEKLINKNYLLEVSPPPGGYYIYLTILFAIMLSAGIYFTLRKVPKVYRKFNKKISTVFLTTSIIGLFLIFSRFEQIPYLGSRLMIVLLLGIFIIWILTIYWYKFVKLPKEIIKLKQKENFNKYLP